MKSLCKPILLGTHKSFIGRVLDLSENQRMEGTAATVAISGIANGNDIVRVHDVEQMLRVCRMSFDAIIRGKE